MRIELIDDHAVSTATRGAIARYRHRVFIESLQWDLPCEPGHEQDEFDADGATHLAAFDGDAVVGYARLLPTLRPYLLQKHFSHLIGNGVAPQSPQVWELSRFAAGQSAQPGSASDAKAQTRIGKRVLLEAVRFVMAQAGEQLVCCTTVAVERLAQRWGVDIERLGPPVRSSAGLLVAARIHCSRQTLEALDPALAMADRDSTACPAIATSSGASTTDPIAAMAGLLRPGTAMPAGNANGAHSMSLPGWRVVDSRGACAVSPHGANARAVAV